MGDVGPPVHEPVAEVRVAERGEQEEEALEEFAARGLGVGAASRVEVGRDGQYVCCLSLGNIKSVLLGRHRCEYPLCDW